jgi:hypothetical protein
MRTDDELFAAHTCGWDQRCATRSSRPSTGSSLPGMPVVGNHNPTFAPAIQPTVRTGTEAAIAAALAYLGRG